MYLFHFPVSNLSIFLLKNHNISSLKEIKSFRKGQAQTFSKTRASILKLTHKSFKLSIIDLIVSNLKKHGRKELVLLIVVTMLTFLFLKAYWFMEVASA